MINLEVNLLLCSIYIIKVTNAEIKITETSDRVLKFSEILIRKTPRIRQNFIWG